VVISKREKEDRYIFSLHIQKEAKGRGVKRRKNYKAK